jgi:hypothetical protein
VKEEGVENVGEEYSIKTETEDDCIQLLGTVKCEQEVSVCGSDLFIGVCVWGGTRACAFVRACVLYCTLCLVTHSFHMCIPHLFIFCMSISRMYLCGVLRLM